MDNRNKGSENDFDKKTLKKFPKVMPCWGLGGRPRPPLPDFATMELFITTVNNKTPDILLGTGFSLSATSLEESSPNPPRKISTASSTGSECSTGSGCITGSEFSTGSGSAGSGRTTGSASSTGRGSSTGSGGCTGSGSTTGIPGTGSEATSDLKEAIGDRGHAVEQPGNKDIHQSPISGDDSQLDDERLLINLLQDLAAPKPRTRTRTRRRNDARR